MLHFSLRYGGSGWSAVCDSKYIQTIIRVRIKPVAHAISTAPLPVNLGERGMIFVGLVFRNHDTGDPQ